MKNCIASFKTSCQISPDDFEVYRRTLLCDDNTTIGQIRAWANFKDSSLNVHLDDADELPVKGGAA